MVSLSTFMNTRVIKNDPKVHFWPPNVYKQLVKYMAQSSWQLKAHELRLLMNLIATQGLDQS
jgi:hypothetical protein